MNFEKYREISLGITHNVFDYDIYVVSIYLYIVKSRKLLWNLVKYRKYSWNILKPRELTGTYVPSYIVRRTSYVVQYCNLIANQSRRFRSKGRCRTLSRYCSLISILFPYLTGVSYRCFRSETSGVTPFPAWPLTMVIRYSSTPTGYLWYPIQRKHS